MHSFRSEEVLQMKIMLDNGAKMPTRAHPWDAGLDLYAMHDGEVYLNTVFDTGVHVEIPEGYVGFIKSKSGLMVNHNITTDGTIDAHYTGSIKVKLFNHGEDSYLVHAGDKIAQLVIVPCIQPRMELVDSLEETDRGDNGFGSTGYR
jgi:dUTP pyrophosphatase